MALLDKPAWWGVSVLNSTILRRMLFSLALMVAASVALALLLASIQPPHPDGFVRRVLDLSLGFCSFVLILSAFPYFFFFWFRCVANALAFRARRIPRPIGEHFSNLWNPFYGWRQKDLLPEGLPYWHLCVEGFVGGWLCAGVFLFGFWLSRVAGIGT